MKTLVGIGIFYVNNSNQYIFLEGKEVDNSVDGSRMFNPTNLAIIESYQETCNKLTYQGSLPGCFVVCLANYENVAVYNLTNRFTIDPEISGLLTGEFIDFYLGIVS